MQNSNAAPVGRQSGQLKLRLPDELRESLKRKAAANRRSLNSEILVCLEKAVASTTEGEPNGTRA